MLEKEAGGRLRRAAGGLEQGELLGFAPSLVVPDGQEKPRQQEQGRQREEEGLDSLQHRQ
jgi:hypothetical protein